MIRAFFEEEPDGKPDDWPKRRVDTSPKYSRLVIMLILEGLIYSDGRLSPEGCPKSKLPKWISLTGRRLPDGSSNHKSGPPNIHPRGIGG